MDQGTRDTPPAIECASDALRDVAAERRRQIEAEGWTPEHDDQHNDGELSLAASGYAMAASDQIQAVAHKWDDDSSMDDFVIAPTVHEPWPHGWEFKLCTPRQALVKAGALILAEIERLDRLQPNTADDRPLVRSI